MNDHETQLRQFLARKTGLSHALLEQPPVIRFVRQRCQQLGLADTRAYLESLVRSDDDRRIRVIVQENQGANAARNHGLDEIRGKYVQFLDSDDRLAAEKIRVQVQSLERTGNALAICGDLIRVVEELESRVDMCTHRPGESASEQELLGAYGDGYQSGYRNAIAEAEK